jgi:hypothetical protein
VSGVAAAPLLLLIVLLGAVRWVHQDATAHRDADRPVVFRAGTLVIDTPAAWAMACLALSVLAFPLYLNCRSTLEH